MDSEWIDDPRGRTLRVGDRVRYLDSREVGPERVIQHASATGFTVDALPAVWRPRDYSTAHDRVLASTRWQYHAPTRAKLEAADRERVTVVSITDDTMTVRPAPPPDSEPGWDHVPAEYYDVGSRFSIEHGDKLIRPSGEWSAIRGPIHITDSCSEYWVRRAAHPERVRWLAERKRAANTDSAIVAAVDSESTYACAPSKQKFPGAVIHCPECGVTVAEGDWCSCVTEAERDRHYAAIRGNAAPRYSSAAVNADQLCYKAGPDARTIRVTVNTPLVSRDDAREAVRDETVQVPVARSVECLSCGTWRTSSFPVCACGETRILAECSGFRGGIQTPSDVNALMRELAAASAPTDPFAAVRAEAKHMMDNGADPRLVLGALDECVTSGKPGTWNTAVAAAVAHYSVEAIEYSMSQYQQRRFGPCYHGNRAGTCGWCALSRDRSDARAVASHEPAWETADCEGE